MRHAAQIESLQQADRGIFEVPIGQGGVDRDASNRTVIVLRDALPGGEKLVGVVPQKVNDMRGEVAVKHNPTER